MTIGIYKMDTRKLNIKYQFHYHYENFIKPKNLEN